MIERLANLWEESCDARCITTNGFIKKNGALVMGAGTAGQAQSKWPDLPFLFGEAVRNHGNTPYYIDHDGERFVSFPVKHAWYEKADLALIEKSAHSLMALIELQGWKKVLLPLPGCGNGQLSWSDVRPVLAPILDDRVHVISNSLSKDFNPDA